MTGQIDVALAISLHAPNDKLRSEIMPINDRWDIQDFLASVRRYIASSNANRGKVTVEYVLLDHVNDDMDHARELAELLKDTPAKINLIPFNPYPGSPYKKPSNSRIDRFMKTLMKYDYTVTVRKTRGDDIDAACGQLVGDVIDRTKRTQQIAAQKVSRRFQSKRYNSYLDEHKAKFRLGFVVFAHFVVKISGYFRVWR